jgi:NAD(P)H-hydrate epimerase
MPYPVPMPASLRLTRTSARALDSVALSEFGLPGVVLMENAGGGAAERILSRTPSGALVTIVCGPGNNGGDGWVVARHLYNAGVDVRCVATVAIADLRGDAATLARAVPAMGIPVVELTSGPAWSVAAQALNDAAWIVDALLGTGFEGTPRSEMARVIELVRTCERPVVALDVPSGFDCDSGRAAQPCVRASWTLTFAAEKIGFDAPGARDWLGDVEVVPIGVPSALVARLALPVGGELGNAGALST